MSEIKNDPTGIKQKIAVVILTLGAICILFFSGTGASLDCKENGECELRRRDLFSKTSETFRWQDVTFVHLVSGGGLHTTGGSRRGVASANILFDIKPDRKVFLYASGFGWIVGSLDHKFLYNHLSSKSIPKKVWGVSLGGPSWFISFVMGAIAVIVILLSIVEKFRPEMNEKEIQSARIKNLTRFSILISVSTAIWTVILFSLFFWFGLGL